MCTEKKCPVCGKTNTLDSDVEVQHCKYCGAIMWESNKKRRTWDLGGMLLIAVLACIIIWILVTALGKGKIGDYIFPNVSAKSCIGEDYSEVQQKFENFGFKNITISAQNDVEGVNENAVTSVSINGDSNFKRFIPQAVSAKVEICYFSNLVVAPKSARDCKGRGYQDIIEEFKTAGFTNITTTVDDSIETAGKYKDDEVESISIDGDNDFPEGSEYVYDVAVVVFYHSDENNICMDKSNKELQNMKYPDLKVYLENLGFTNIESVPINDIKKSDDKNNNMVESISINSDSSIESDEYFRKDDLIRIEYHCLKEDVKPKDYTESDEDKIEVRASDDIVKENYKTVISELERLGFTNIEAIPNGKLVNGLLHDKGEIERITIKGESEFVAGSLFAPDVHIRITYFSYEDEEVDDLHDYSNMLELSEKSSYYKGKKYEQVYNELKDKGFMDITCEGTGKLNAVTAKIWHENTVKSVSIDGDESFKKGDSYDKDAKITITYYSFSEE